MQIGINLSLTNGGSSNGFSIDDTTNGTLILNFVDRPPDFTLSLNFLTEQYQIWEVDTTIAGEIGYYQIKV